VDGMVAASYVKPLLIVVGFFAQCRSALVSSLIVWCDSFSPALVVSCQLLLP